MTENSYEQTAKHRLSFHSIKIWKSLSLPAMTQQSCSSVKLLYYAFLKTEPALHCWRPQPCVGGNLVVPLPKPARGLGRDSSAQVSSQDAYMREEMQGKTASRYGKD